MRILPRYIVFQHFLPIMGLAISAFTGLYLIIDFFEKIDDFLEKNVPALETFTYFLFKVPFIVNQGVPMAALLATLISLGILSRNREIIALKAAGIGESYYVSPIVVTALVLSLIHFSMGETIVRPMWHSAEQIWQQEVQHRKASPAWLHENVWYRGKTAIFQIRLYDKSKTTLEKVSLFYLDPEFKLTQRLDAKRFRWDGQGWVAEEGIVLRFAEPATEQEVFQERRLDLPEKPGDFDSLEKVPEELNWLSLYRFAKEIQKEGYNATPYQVELHLRLATPLTTLILVLLGIVVALGQGLHTGIALSVGIALAAASGYVAVLQLGCSLATAGILPPFLGVWLGNMIFAALAVYLWMRNTERQ